MSKKIIFSVIIIIAAVLLAIFVINKSNEPEPVIIVGNYSDINYTQVSPRYAINVKDANNQFALDLYSLYNKEEGNVFYSPYSISSALTMTFEGAKGKTAEEMRSVLHLPEDTNKIREEYKSIFTDMNEPNKPYILKTSNALWAQDNYPFLDEYFNNVETYYDGNVKNLDFVRDTENSRVTINDWVEEQTYDRIKELIPEGAIKEYTVLVLTNTLYFKGNWSMKFDTKNTKDADFTLDNQEKVKVKMMNEKSYYNYGENDEAQIIELNYKGDDLSMLVILPKGNMSDFEKSISNEKIAELKNASNMEKVILSLPKFKFETKYEMSETLKKMGMPTAFDKANADFTGMFDQNKSSGNLYIDKVIHQTFIEVTEDGTEAAAATAILMGEITSINPVVEEPKVFNADHPFIFVIQQKDTGNILFMGRVSNPDLD